MTPGAPKSLGLSADGQGLADAGWRRFDGRTLNWKGGRLTA